MENLTPKHLTETTSEPPPWNGQLRITGGLKLVLRRQPHPP